MSFHFGRLPMGNRKESVGSNGLFHNVPTAEGTVGVAVIMEGQNPPHLRMVVGYDKEEYGFTLQAFSDRDREWLLSVVPSQIERAYRQGFREGMAYVREPIKAALGIKE